MLEDLTTATAAYAQALITSSRSAAAVILGSIAATEIVNEQRLRYRHYSEPVSYAHSAIRLGHFALADQLLTLSRLVTLDPPAVYAPFVVTRSLLDTAGWIYWLAEPNIGVDLRVKRRLVLDILEAAEQRPPNRPEFKAKLARLSQIPKDVHEFCVHHTWTVKIGQQAQVDGEHRPSRAQLIAAVIDSVGSDPGGGLGATWWWYLSGYTHGSLEGLLGVVEEADEIDPSRGNGTIVIDGQKLVWLMVVAAEATKRVTSRRVELFKDVDAEVNEAARSLDTQRIRYLEAVRNGEWPGATGTR